MERLPGDDLLQPKWKGRMILDTLSHYLLASFEHAWGKKKRSNT
jgi:hypothetical protein